MDSNTDGLITQDLLIQWVHDQRDTTRNSGAFSLQKPSTVALLKDWRESSKNGLKKFLSQHPAWGTAVVEEWGAFGPGIGWLEGRVPAVLGGMVLGVFAIKFLSSAFLLWGVAVISALVWSRLRPQLKFVTDHGEDQSSRISFFVRSGHFYSTRWLSLVAALLLYAGADSEFGTGVAVLSLLSPLLALGASIGTHALLNFLDVFPDTNARRTDFESGAPPNPDVKKDPVSTHTERPRWCQIDGKTLDELDKIFQTAADHDLGGSDNDYLNKHANGVLGTPQADDVLATSKNFSPYWWQRFWISEGVRSVGGFIEKGEGGDDYKMYFNSDDFNGTDGMKEGMQSAIDYEHDRMKDQFAFYSIYENGKRVERGNEKHVVVEFGDELKKEGRMVIVRHGNGLTLGVRCESPEDHLVSIVNLLWGLSKEGLSYRRLDDTRLGLGLFSYSMGGVRVGDVVRRLQRQTNTNHDDWFDTEGRLRSYRVKDVEEWTERLAEDMLGVAKGRGRRQAFLAPDLDILMSHERKGTVATYAINVEGAPKPQEFPRAFRVMATHDFWEAAKKSEERGQEKHVVIFEIAQYRRQPVSLFGISLFEVFLRYVPVRVGRFIPARWVQGLEKRIQSRAFHSWQGTDQKGKGNPAIEENFQFAMGSLGSKKMISNRPRWADRWILFPY